MNQIQTQYRVAIPILGITFALCLALYFLLTWQPNREARRGFEAKSESIVRLLSRVVASPLEFDDAEAARRDISVTSSESSIAYVAVRKADGKTVLAAVNPGRVPE